MLGKSMVVDTKKFFGEVQAIEIKPKDKKAVNESKINRLQAMKAINEEILKIAYINFIESSNDLTNTENELKKLLEDNNR